MMTKIKGRLRRAAKGKRGAAMIFTCVLFLIAMMFGTVVWEYLRIEVIAFGVRSAVENAMVAVGTQNTVGTYFGEREGYTGAYELDAGRFSEVITKEDIMTAAAKPLNMVGSGTTYVSYAGGEKEYTLTLRSLEFTNERFADNGREETRFYVTALLDITIPHSFGWVDVPDTTATIKVKGEFSQIF